MSAQAAIDMKIHDDAFKLIPGTHYEVNASATDPYMLADECADRSQYAVFPDPPGVCEYVSVQVLECVGM